MTVPEVIGVGALGGVGAVGRFLLDGGVGRRVRSAFPYGTFAVNMLGSFLLGAFAGARLHAEASLLLGTGLIGAFTTFSTWTFESHRLAEERRSRLGTLNLVLSLTAGIGAAWLGRRLGAAV